MVSVLLPSAQRVRLQSEGTTAVELQVEQHPRSSGEFTCTSPIGDWFLARSAGLDFPIIRSRSYIDGWLPLLACAAGAIRTYSECAHAWIVQLVSAALPVASQGDSVGSASREEMLGLVYLPGTSLFDQLVECLLHEAMHQLLFRLEECGPLFSEDDGREVYYSPWRSDPRPLRMILHGAFVFTAVADLYSKLGPTVLEVSLEESHARAYLRSLQARCALATVTKHGKMTRFGQEVIRAIGHTLDSLPQPTPQKAECRAVEAALTCHRNDHAHYMS